MKKLLWIIIAFSINHQAYSKKDGETRSTKFSMDMSEVSTVELQAKFTELNIETWNKNELELTATIRYDGEITDEMKEFLEEFDKIVKQNIKNNESEIKINSELGFPIGGVKKSFFGLVMEVNIRDYDRPKLTYNLKLPKSSRIIIENSYEDINLKGFYKKIEIQQYSGNIKAESVDKLKLQLRYGSASIDTVNIAEAELYENDLTLRQCNTLDVTAKYSDIEIDHANSIKGEWYESNLEGSYIQSLTGNFKYGEIEVNEKLSYARLNIYETDIDVKEAIEINVEDSKYSKVEGNYIERLLFMKSYEDKIDIEKLGSLECWDSKYGEYSIHFLVKSLKLNTYEDDLNVNTIGKTAEVIEVNGKYTKVFLKINDIPFNISYIAQYGDLKYDQRLVDVTWYSINGDKKEIELSSKDEIDKKNKVNILTKGYELDVILSM